MVRNRNALQGLSAALGLLVLILDSARAVEGAAAGLELCIRTVIPSLFPFFVLSSVLTASLSGAALTIPGRALGISRRGAPVLIPAFLGGYPVGAKCVGDLYQQKQVSRREAERLLTFCSNAGPSFLFGIVASFFPDRCTTWAIWLIHMGSAVLTAMVIPGIPEEDPATAPEAEKPKDSALYSAAKAMALVCCWVILFRMIIAFLEDWFMWMLPDWARVLLAGCLELTNGCCRLAEISDVDARFVLCSTMLSFGGVCVLLQTASVTTGLDLRWYLQGKLLQTLFSLVLSCGIAAGYGLIAAVLLPISVVILRKIQIRYGNPRLIPV